MAFAPRVRISFIFIPVSIAQKAFDARGNGTGTPIGGGALNSGTTCRYPRFFHSLLLSIKLTHLRRGVGRNKRIYLLPQWRIQALRVSRPIVALLVPVVSSHQSLDRHAMLSSWCGLRVSGSASSLTMALLLEYRTWCRTARSLSDAQTCGAAGKPN